MGQQYWRHRAAFDSYLLLRGMRTLSPRIKAAQHNARRLSAIYSSNPWSKSCIILPCQKTLAMRLRAVSNVGSVAMLSFELDGDEALLRRFLSALELFTLAESLGGVESLISHAATMTHAGMAPEARAAAGFPKACCVFPWGLKTAKI
ncbi:Cystathionine gamma-synthase [Serratia fonticola]|uniref:Cystathionine gamma-synthase n=1 Tax=Serratia fonticola TaxID=47917 RepID=A0A4U9THG0_SERFO|nr:Cystathionine gamma-synthase [Serratia fonticola]